MTDPPKEAVEAILDRRAGHNPRNDAERLDVERDLEAAAPAIRHQRDEELREMVRRRLDPIELALSGIDHVEDVLDSVTECPQEAE